MNIIKELQSYPSIYDLFNDACSRWAHKVPVRVWEVNDELERIRKEEIIA
jgi:hypothetical protein